MGVDNPFPPCPWRGVYFDNAAAAPPSTAFLELFLEYAAAWPANQEAAHGAGRATRLAMEAAAHRLAESLLGTREQAAEVVWCDSVTAAAAAIFTAPWLEAAALAVSAAEHPAVAAAAARHRAPTGVVGVDGGGMLDFSSLAAVLAGRPAALAVHHVQAETGRVQPLEEIRRVIDDISPETLLIVDAAQSAGKLPIPWNTARIDAALISGAKLGCPAAAAAVFRRHRGRDWKEHFQTRRGGEHLMSRPYPPTALAMAAALSGKCGAPPVVAAGAAAVLADKLRRGLEAIELPGGGRVRITIPAAVASPFIVHFTVPGYQGEVLARMLSGRGVALAPGSACAAAGEPSRALLAMGFPRKDAYSGLRASFWTQNTPEEVDVLLEVLQSVIGDY